MELSTLVVILLPLIPVIYWIVDMSKDVTNRDFSGLVTKVLSFCAAYLVLWLFANSDINLGTDNAATNAHDVLSVMAWQGLALLALVIASSSGLTADYLRARNPADLTVKPKLLPPFKQPNP